MSFAVESLRLLSRDETCDRFEAVWNRDVGQTNPHPTLLFRFHSTQRYRGAIAMYAQIDANAHLKPFLPRVVATPDTPQCIALEHLQELPLDTYLDTLPNKALPEPCAHYVIVQLASFLRLLSSDLGQPMWLTRTLRPSDLLLRPSTLQIVLLFPLYALSFYQTTDVPDLVRGPIQAIRSLLMVMVQHRAEHVSPCLSSFLVACTAFDSWDALFAHPWISRRGTSTVRCEEQQL